MVELFKNKSFILLFVGGLVSEIGNTLYIFAIGLFILDVTGSSLQMGTFMAVSLGIRVIVSPLAGVMVDRWNRVKVIFVTDYIRGITLVIAGFYIFSGISDTQIITVLYIAGIILSFCGSFFSPAAVAALPDIVGEDNLQAANGASSLIGALQGIFGLLLGAIIYTLLGIEWVIILNAVTFMISGFSEMFIKQKFKKIKEINEHDQIQEKKKFFSDLMFGFNYLTTRKGLLHLAIYSLLLNFAFSPLLSNGLPYLFRIDLGKEPIHLAGTEIAFSVAMIFASIIIGSLKFKKNSLALKTGIIGLSVSFIIIALLSHLILNDYIGYILFYWLFITNMMFLAFMMILVNVPLFTSIMKAIDADVRGRVLSVISSLSSLAVPFSLLIGGFIIDKYNITILGITCVLILLMPTIGIVFDKSITSLADSPNKKTDITEEDSLIIS